VTDEERQAATKRAEERFRFLVVQATWKHQRRLEEIRTGEALMVLAIILAGILTLLGP
jgi:hypothetical protein